MKFLSLNIGTPQIVIANGRQYSTAINRKPVEGRIHLTATGFEGDRVSELSVHGGPDKAVCCYAHEHYGEVARFLGKELDIPSFGENLTTEGMLETQVSLGDIYRIGGAIVQVSQPRQPCNKLAGKHEEPRLIKWINETAFTGFYFRVIQAGDIQSGDSIELQERLHANWTVEAMIRTMVAQPFDGDRAEALASVPELSESWKKSLRRKIAPVVE